MSVTQSIPEHTVRLDGVEKVTGAATYAADVTRPGMLHARVLRSPMPHARIVSIDASRARTLPGVHAVLTGQDIPPYLMGRSTQDMPILAQGKVRFIGEKVAAVAAEDVATAEEALGLIEVEYEELPAVFDPVEATQPDAPLIHNPEDVRARKTPRQVVGDYPNSIGAPRYGNSLEEVEAAFAQADYVFEHTYRTPVQHQGYIEPHSALAEWDERGVVHLWASNKAPFLLLDYLQRGMGLTREQVEIHLLPLGGDFGGKGSFMDIPLVILLAREAKRPVKLVMSYAEELQAGNPRHAAVIIHKSGFTKDGRMVAHLTRSYYASGGYAAFKPAPDATLPGVKGGGIAAYDIPTWRVEGNMVYTNTVPGGHMRAPGEAQPTHAMECHLELCAREMGLDSVQVRMLNARHEPRETRTGEPGTRPKSREVLELAAKAIGWDEPRPENVGRGIALVEVGNSLGEYTAEMVVERDGEIVLHTPMVENGAGMLTVFRQMMAEAWGVPQDQVRVVQTMEGIEYDRGVGGSRITRIIGRMIELMSGTLQQRLAGLVAGEFGHQPEAVSIEPGGFRTPDGQFLSVAEAAALAGDDVLEHLKYKPDEHDVVEVMSAQAAEVEIDPDTGRVHVRRIVTAHEVGRIINPIFHQGQIDGGLISGFGYAMTEGLRIEEGRVTNLNLHEYKLPCAADIPELETILLPPDLSLGITPIGEGPNCGASACIVNAVVDVVGPHVIQIPIDANAVRRLAAKRRGDAETGGRGE